MAIFSGDCILPSSSTGTWYWLWQYYLAASPECSDHILNISKIIKKEPEYQYLLQICET